MENKLNHKVIKDFVLGKSIVIKKIVESDISQWRLYLPFAMLAYNSHAHTVNPFALMSVLLHRRQQLVYEGPFS
jgi:hypothetical protein